MAFQIGDEVRDVSNVPYSNIEKLVVSHINPDGSLRVTCESGGDQFFPTSEVHFLTADYEANFSSAEPELQFCGDIPLTATDEVQNSEQIAATEEIEECDHLTYRWYLGLFGFKTKPNEFCPKCGEKL